MQRVLIRLIMALIVIVTAASTFTIPPATAQDSARITIDLAAPGTPINPLVLGNNIQWTDNADMLLLDGSTAFHPIMLDWVLQIRPTAIRFPGGAQGDFYHWQDGMGPLAERGQNRNYFTGEMETVTFGTREFLTLCALADAEPLITVNITSGTAEEAAAWVEQVNVTGLTAEDGTPLPRVTYWEIGNEPYLQSEQYPDINLTPEDYARKADAFIRAMRAVDPTIQVGIPLQNDSFGSGIPATQYEDYSRRVLRTLTEPFDWVAVHDAYRPVALWGPYEGDALYWGMMAAARGVAEDFDRTHALLAEFYPDRTFPLAVTEWNAFYTLLNEPYDRTITAQMSQLYLVDALHTFAARDDLLMANHWSLLGNWYFGAVSFFNEPRPSFPVLSVYCDVLVGDLLPVTVESPPFANQAVGWVNAYEDTPLISALAVRDGSVLRISLINKHIDQPQTITIAASGSNPALAVQSARVLTSADYMDGAVHFAEPQTTPIDWAALGVSATAFPFEVILPPHAIAVIELVPG